MITMQLAIYLPANVYMHTIYAAKDTAHSIQIKILVVLYNKNSRNQREKRQASIAKTQKNTQKNVRKIL